MRATQWVAPTGVGDGGGGCGGGGGAGVGVPELFFGVGVIRWVGVPELRGWVSPNC